MYTDIPDCRLCWIELFGKTLTLDTSCAHRTCNNHDIQPLVKDARDMQGISSREVTEHASMNYAVLLAPVVLPKKGRYAEVTRHIVGTACARQCGGLWFPWV